MSDSDELRACAIGPLPRPVDACGTASLYAWTHLFWTVLPYIPEDERDSRGFLRNLPGDYARRTFLLLVAEALEAV
jgi:hypothetical protein